MDPTRSPVARELFAQWQRARGSREEPSSRPFTRDWEDLLEDAGLVSATDRSDAERDAHSMETASWVELKPVRYKPHWIARIALPIAAESRWCEAFDFVPASDEDARQIRAFNWVPRLSFLRTSRLNIPFEELRRLDEFLHAGQDAAIVVPIKERSLQIFGDEKRLDALFGSALFRIDRLDLLRDLRCEPVGEPLGWKRGPSSAAARPLIVIENAATWHSYCRWNAERVLFSAVIYGCGNRFVDGIRYLPDLFAELGGPRPIFYFGDLDPQGLRIPQEASNRAQVMGLPEVEAHLWSYRHLLALGEGRGQPWDGEPPTDTPWEWLKEQAEPARRLISAGQRLAQEHLGWNALSAMDHDGSNLASHLSSPIRARR